jgi:hypothetical protein
MELGTGKGSDVLTAEGRRTDRFRGVEQLLPFADLLKPHDVLDVQSGAGALTGEGGEGGGGEEGVDCVNPDGRSPIAEMSKTCGNTSRCPQLGAISHS